MTLRAPFWWFGGKRMVAETVWSYFGDVKTYIEPFLGSAAILLARPDPKGLEIANDKDLYVVNFWRAMKHNPSQVKDVAKDMIHEANLHSRHKWLVTEGKEILKQCLENPEFYNEQAAAYWVYGKNLWIGQGFCKDNGKISKQKLAIQRQGIHAQYVQEDIDKYFDSLYTRVSTVDFLCGDWNRVVTKSYAEWRPPTAIFLDPPYDFSDRTVDLYTVEEDISQSVARWAEENGDNPRLRIILCGYEGHYAMPDTWRKVSWKANGGFGNQGSKDNANAHREVLWISPHCLQDDQRAYLKE